MDENNLVEELKEIGRIWREISPRDQDLLLKIIENYPPDEENLINLVNDSAIKSITAKNIVRVENERIIFTSTIMKVYIQAQLLIKTNLLITHTPQEIITFLSNPIEKFHNQSEPDQNSFVCCIFFILINGHHRKDLLPLLCKYDHYWQFTQAINLYIPLLECDLEELADFFVCVSNLTKQDLAVVFFNSAVSRFGFFQPQIALELINFLINKNDGQSSSVIEFLLLGISSASQKFHEDAINLMEDLLNSPILLLNEIGLLSLLRLLKTDEYDLDKFFRLAVKQMEKVEEQKSYSLAYAFVMVGLNYSNYSSQAFNQLVRLKTLCNSGRVNFGIASVMAVNNATHNDFFWQCMDLLSDTSAKDKDTIQLINNILYSFTTSDPMIVWKFVEAWILKYDEEESLAERDLFLKPIQYSYTANPQIGSEIITTWFLSENHNLIDEARRIIINLRIQSFSKQVLEKLSAIDTIYIVEKLLFGYIDSNQLFHLFFSIVNNTIHFDQLNDYFSETLFNLVLMYPGTSKEYFDKKYYKDDTGTANFLIQQLAGLVEEYQNKLKAAKVLLNEEFPGSERRSRKYREFEIKKMQSISKSVMENDHSLLSYLSKVMIGRGNRSFHMNIFDQDAEKRKTFSPPQGFAEYSQTIEMPITELIDPEGEIIKRLNRKYLRKRDIQVDNE